MSNQQNGDDRKQQTRGELRINLLKDDKHEALLMIKEIDKLIQRARLLGEEKVSRDLVSVRMELEGVEDRIQNRIKRHIECLEEFGVRCS